MAALISKIHLASISKIPEVSLYKIICTDDKRYCQQDTRHIPWYCSVSMIDCSGEFVLRFGFETVVGTSSAHSLGGRVFSRRHYQISFRHWQPENRYHPSKNISLTQVVYIRSLLDFSEIF